MMRLFVLLCLSTSVLLCSGYSYANPSSNEKELVTEDKEVTEEKEEGETLASERKSEDQSKKIIKEVMKTKNLDDQATEMRWVRKDIDEEPEIKANWLKLLLSPVAKIIATVFETGLWILLIIGLFFLFYFRKHWLHLFEQSKKTEDSYEAPEVMFGMDVRPDSLPDDISGEAKKLWQHDKHRESLSLLYRGALVHLINQEKVRLENSNTEGDVLKISARTIAQSKQEYLQRLTRQWQAIAYAHRTPDDAMHNTMNSLFEHWEGRFVSAPSTTQQEGK